jgi:uncharacterized membrane protein
MIHNTLGAAHVTAAIAALALGLVGLSAAKGDVIHRLFGAGYVISMLVVNATALGIYRLNGQFGPFHALALLSLGGVALGTLAVLRRRGNGLVRHYQAMAYSYLGLWAAAAAEAVIRIKIFGALTSGPRGAMAIGVGIAVLFAAFGYLVIPRLQRAALGAVADR